MSNSNNRIYDKIDRLDEKIDNRFEKVDKRLDQVEKELAIYNTELTYHIEGVKQAKQQNELLKTYIDIESEKLRKDFAPVKKHVEKVNSFISTLKTIFSFLLKVVGAASVVFGAYAKYKGII